MDMESLGAKRKFWYLRDDRRYLFKAEERGTGDDWAEKIVCELAALLGIPHVQYEMAIETAGGIPGIVCETLVPKPLSLIHGNELLGNLNPN